ncbi:hypothetical protein [Desulfuromonas thiophila]|uniref:Uncharacterized protein n=1 Tax=Desulfuromonas thiophila TaxID=57664 RepID=A0A1G6XZA7_9BACT|nr:hypothetical protein [Desulfuromonas thiophila]SDD83400.1 hypothetical protein SAMN05661003_101453 [Desulfuromonas thiophila]
MKTTMKAALLSLTSVLAASPVFAASQRSDHSGLLVWLFLGFCALIVVAQLVPAVMLMLGIVKGVASSKSEASEKA